MLRIIGKSPYKGFMIKDTLSVDSDILVLTGKNGSGKTRFLEGVGELSSVIELEGVEVHRTEVLLLGQASLVSTLKDGYRDYDYVNRVKQTADYFESRKKIFVDPYVFERAQSSLQEIQMAQYSGLPYGKLHPLVNLIATRSGRSVEDLTGEDVKLNYQEFLDSPFDVSNISLICNSYRRRLDENQYNLWRACVKGQNVSYVSEEEVEVFFGPKPWLVVNEIIDYVFDGKFEFSSPDEQSEVYDYSAKLIVKETGFHIGVESLSTGEKTLFWLALTLINTQYSSSFSKGVPRVLLLDEPDAFLHPKMVVKLYRVLEKFTEIFRSVVIFTTHSPTTVALAPKGSVCMVTESSMSLIDRDLAISSLLDGVNQISIDPENRRTVFVESLYDLNLYSSLYNYLRAGSGGLASEISLTFVSSGEKLPAERIETAVRSQIDDNEELVRNIVAAINGVGSCSHVYSAVQDFGDANKKYIRGVVDWDGSNKVEPGVVVLAPGYAYTTENLGLDPLSILLLLHIDYSGIYPVESFCGEAVSWREWLSRSELLQRSLDIFMESVFGRANRRDADLIYTSGLKLLTDREYLNHGEGLEQLVVSAYDKLKSYRKNGAAKDLKYTVVTKSMITLSEGTFIPVQFLEVFRTLQV